MWEYIPDLEPNKPYVVTIKRFRPPRSTGEGSQNHHINGHVQDIAKHTGASFDAVKMYCKFLAIDYGYPFEIVLHDKETLIPYSETRINTKDASFLIDAIHRLAAEEQIPLKEIDW
jgi:hypothetical protein